MKVQQYGEPQAQTEVVRGPQASTLPIDSFSGSNLAKVATSAAGAMQQIDQRVGTTMAEEALVKFERDKNALLLNFGTKQGKSAFDGSKDASEALQKLHRDHSASITNETARKAFDRVAANHVSDGLSRIGSHAMGGLKQWEGQTLDARMENHLENIALNRNDDKKVAIEITNLTHTINEKADHMGLPTDDPARAEMVQSAQSMAAQNIIKASLADGAGSGKKALDRYGSLLEGGEAAQFGEQIKKKAEIEKDKADTQYAISMADRLAKRFASDPANIQYDAINAEISKIKDPETRDKLRRQADHITASIERSHNAQVAQFTHEASDANMSGQSIQMWAASNPDKWSKLPEDVKRKMEGGAYITTDPVALNKLYSLPPEDFLRIDVNSPALVGTMSAADKKSFMSAQKDMREGKGINSVISNSQVIHQTVDSVFGKDSKRNDEEKEAALQFTLQANDALRAEALARGKELTPVEVNNLMKNVTSEFVLKSRGTFSYFDKTLTAKDTPMNELYSMHHAVGTVEGATNETVYDTVQSMKAEGLPITPRSVSNRVKQEMRKPRSAQEGTGTITRYKE